MMSFADHDATFYSKVETRHRHPRDDPREEVGEGVGVVECGL